MSFDNFAGNEHLKTQLKRYIKSGQIHNSYVFAGEEGIGKKTLSQEFIKGLFCESPINDEACGKCALCRQLASASLPDICYLQKPKDKKSYGIEEIREQIIKQVYAGSVQVQGQLNIGFRSFAADFTISHNSTSFSVLIRISICSLVPMVMRLYWLIFKFLKCRTRMPLLFRVS